MKSCTYWERLSDMSVVAVAVVCTVVCASDARGQTLFARPDTTPSYSSYQHIEECWSAGVRISDVYESIRDSVWWDTIPGDAHDELMKQRFVTRRPESAITKTNVCLKTFDADTATFLSPYSASRIVKILLIAHRDQDAYKFAQRALDSLRQKSSKDYKIMLTQLIYVYGHARPVRYDETKQYYARTLAAFKGDSLYYGIDVARLMNDVSEIVNDTVTRDAARQLAIRLNDSTPEEERRHSPGSDSRLGVLTRYVASVTQHDALDSLAISNLAYELWYANTVKRRVSGGELVTRSEIAEVLDKRKMKIQGDHYYIASTATSSGASTHGLATYTSEGALPTGALPIKNAINYVTAMSTLCQTEFRSKQDYYNANSTARGGCLLWATHIRNLKHEFPDIEIIGLSNTYGTVGTLGPLPRAEEADTLAKLFLGFHRLPVRLVIENTEFYHLAKPDNRRIDIDTPNSEAFCDVKSLKCYTYTDKDGNMITPYVNNDPAWFKRFYEILKNRPSQ